MTLFLLVLVTLLAGLGLWQLLKIPRKPQKTEPEDTSKTTPKVSVNTAIKGSKLKDILTKKLSKVQEEKAEERLRGVSTHQLTMPIKEFTGRKGELLEILTKNREGSRLVLIFGERGIGKTTFALMIGDKLVPFFAQGQIYFDMESVPSEGRPVADAMAHVIQSFRPEVKIPPGEREIAAIYRAILKGQKAVLLFDNVDNARQVKQLVPPKSCTLIVTSKKHIKIPNVPARELTTPPAEDSRDLLLKHCTRVGFWTAEISKSCGHNPLAISLCGKFLSGTEDYDPGAFSTQLRDQQKKLQRGDKDRHQLGLESALTLVLSFLPEPTVKTLAKMVVFPDSFDSQAQGFVCEDKSGDHLNLLSVIGLVNYESDNSRYRIHPMIRECLDRKEFKPYILQAKTRHSTYYMTTLEHINQLYKSKDKAQVIQALKTFNLEWGNIRQGQAWAGENCMKDGDAAKVCNSYAVSGKDILPMRRPPRERLSWFESALTAARYRQDEESEKQHLLCISREYLNLGESKKGSEHMEKVIQMCEEDDNPEVLIEAYLSMGTSLAKEGQFEKGMEQFTKGLEIARRAGDAKAEVQAAEELGNSNIKMNKFHEGLEYLNQALEKARTLGEPNIEARLLLALGKARIKSDDSQNARDDLMKGLALASKNKNPRQEASFLDNLGDVHVSLNEYPQASSFYEKAAILFRKLRDSISEADTLGRQGIAWIKSGNPTGGIQTIEKAIGICKTTKNIVGEMTLLSYLGAALLEIGNIQLATEAFSRQLDLAKKTRSGLVEAKALHQLGQLERKQGNIANAIGHLKTALALYEKAKSPLSVEVRQELETIQKKSKKPTAKDPAS